MPYPKVSIIIPSYNHGAFLESTLLSVEAQTYRDIELIVVEDGSTDDSLAVIERMRPRLKRKPIVLPQRNRGAHKAINRGLAYATGRYVNILNSDDLFTAERIEVLVDNLEAGQSGLAFSMIRCIDGQSKEIGHAHELAGYFYRKQTEAFDYPSIGFALLDSNVAISSGNIFVCTEICRALKGFRNLLYCHDWDFLLRALCFTEPVFVRETTYLYRLHEGNTFRKLEHRARIESGKVLRTYFRAVRRGRLKNALAPAPERWPEDFPRFVAQRGYLPYVSRKADLVSRLGALGRLLGEGRHA